jgi:ankyrin repeat protein
MGKLAVVRYLVEELGADVNQADADGCTCLYIAAQESRLDAVQCLVEELGADVDQAAKDGSTPLMIAAERMQHKVVRYLLKQGVNHRHRSKISARLRTSLESEERQPSRPRALRPGRTAQIRVASTPDSRNASGACKLTSVGVPAFERTSQGTRRSVRRLLPSGRPTRGHHKFVVFDVLLIMSRRHAILSVSITRTSPAIIVLNVGYTGNMESIRLASFAFQVDHNKCRRAAA